MTQAIVPTTPNYLATLFNDSEFKAFADEFGGGLQQTVSFPRIALKGTRFAIKDGDLEQVIPQSTIDVVIVRARPTVDKTFYVSKFDPNAEEVKGPDCYSKDGVKPAADSPIPQADQCANCPMNAFGSGTDANGNPTKGKACADTKQLAIYAQGKVYGFKITPASLKAYNAYLKLLAGYQLTPPVVITSIGFDPNFTYPVLTFDYKGVLGEEQARKIVQLRASQDVEDICGGGTSAPIAPPKPAPVQIQAPTPAPTPDPVFGAFTPEEATPAATPKRARAAKAERLTPEEAIAEPEIEVMTAAPSGPTEADILAKLGL